eukprot:m.55292 g.55292  ORF g.55292 m.55292 type:complete len:1216 (+) comp18618_c0_seq3:73-3720(+)
MGGNASKAAEEQLLFKDICLRDDTQALQAKGLRPNIIVPDWDKQGTVLMFACTFDAPNVVALLLQNQADIDAQDKDGRTALMHASLTQNLQVVVNLLRAGANLEAKDNDGKTALMFACQSTAFNVNVVQELIHWGANVNAINSQRQTALMLAAIDGREDVLQPLLQAMAAAWMQDAAGDTAVDLALAYGHENFVKTLVRLCQSEHVQSVNQLKANRTRIEQLEQTIKNPTEENPLSLPQLQISLAQTIAARSTTKPTTPFISSLEPVSFSLPWPRESLSAFQQLQVLLSAFQNQQFKIRDCIKADQAPSNKLLADRDELRLQLLSETDKFLSSSPTLDFPHLTKQLEQAQADVAHLLAEAPAPARPMMLFDAFDFDDPLQILSSNMANCIECWQANITTALEKARSDTDACAEIIQDGLRCFCEQFQTWLPPPPPSSPPSSSQLSSSPPPSSSEPQPSAPPSNMPPSSPPPSSWFPTMEQRLKLLQVLEAEEKAFPAALALNPPPEAELVVIVASMAQVIAAMQTKLEDSQNGITTLLAHVDALRVEYLPEMQAQDEAELDKGTATMRRLQLEMAHVRADLKHEKSAPSRTSQMRQSKQDNIAQMQQKLERLQQQLQTAVMNHEAKISHLWKLINGPLPELRHTFAQYLAPQEHHFFSSSNYTIRPLSAYLIKGIIEGGGRSRLIKKAEFNNELCILKEFNLSDYSARKVMAREAAILGHLHHPNILSLLGLVFDDHDRGYLHLPFCERGNLTNFLAIHPKPSPVIRTMASELLQAVQYLHLQGVIHCDIKPDNVLVRRGGSVVLADFDVSQDLQGRTTFVKLKASNVGFTYAYAAPELLHVVEGGGMPTSTFACDMYSVGGVMYYMIYHQRTQERREYSRQSSTFGHDNCVLVDAIPIVQALLSEDPSQRPTAHDVLLKPLFRCVESAEFLAVLSPPLYWECNCPDLFFHEVDVTEELKLAMEELMNGTAQPQHHGNSRDYKEPQCFTKFCIQKITRIENSVAWRNYAQKREEIRTHPQLSLPRLDPPVMTTALLHARQDHLSCLANLGSVWTNEVNEHYMFHATEPQNVNSIKQHNFEERVGRLNGMFGSGIYFAESPSKADQYSIGKTSPDGGEKSRFMFLSRVLLGQPFITPDIHTMMRLPPCVELCGRKQVSSTRSHVTFNAACQHDRFHSLVAQTKATNPSAVLRSYREFVVYKGERCYPEYLIEYFRA